VTASDLTLPSATRLIHIGFPKTGTTFVQGAMLQARPKLGEVGVVYPGKERYHKEAGIYIAGATGRLGDPPSTETHWNTLVRQIKAAGDQRVLISSEWMAETDDAGIARVVNELGDGQAHIVATLRPIVKILPSSWQQYLQNGHRFHWEKWLHGVLLEPPYDKPTPSFWRRHRHDEVLARWAKIAGPENVTAIIVDSSDHELLLRQFEQMLAMPAGFLAPEPPAKDNRSLTWPEAEMVRRVNGVFKDRGWPDSLYRSVVRQGIVSRLAKMRPAAGEMPKIPMPDWAAERAAEIGAEFARNIATLGIRVVGDLDSLGAQPAPTGITEAPPTLVPAHIAAEALIAAIARSLEAGKIDSKAASVTLKKEAPPEQKMPPALRRSLLRTRRRIKNY